MDRLLPGLAIVVAGVLLLAPGASGQSPPASDEVIVPPTKTHPPVAKSDQYRVVGKVLDIDRARGVVKLQTDSEGIVEVPAPAITLQAFRVGETVSVARAPGSSPSASPR